MAKREKWPEEIGRVVKLLQRDPFLEEALVKSVAEIVNEASKKRVQRHLALLKKWGLAELRNGKWYWYTRIYKSADEYKILLDHSRKLFHPKTDESGFSYTQVGRLKFSEKWRFILEHLRTGYDEIYQLHRELTELDKQRIKRVNQLERALEQAIKSVGFVPIRDWREVSSTPNAVHLEIVQLGLNFLYRGDSKVEVQGDNILYQGSGIASTRTSDPEEIEQLLEKVRRSKQVKKAFEKMLTTHDEYLERSTELDGKLAFLLTKVDHGEPLKGSCSICPELNITAPMRGGGE